jgi:hypothetical protein
MKYLLILALTLITTLTYSQNIAVKAVQTVTFNMDGDEIGSSDKQYEIHLVGRENIMTISQYHGRLLLIKGTGEEINNPETGEFVGFGGSDSDGELYDVIIVTEESDPMFIITDFKRDLVTHIHFTKL